VAAVVPNDVAAVEKALATRRKQRALVVTDSGLAQSKVLAQLTRVLGEERRGKSWALFHGVRANPGEVDVKEAANALADSPRSSRICRHPIPLGSIPPESGIDPLSFADPEFASGATRAVPWRCSSRSARSSSVDRPLDSNASRHRRKPDV